MDNQLVKFYLNGSEKPASFPLKRGFTYIFNQSNSTNETYGGANHPLMFSTGLPSVIIMVNDLYDKSANRWCCINN